MVAQARTDELHWGTSQSMDLATRLQPALLVDNDSDIHNLEKHKLRASGHPTLTESHHHEVLDRNYGDGFPHRKPCLQRSFGYHRPNCYRLGLGQPIFPAGWHL